MVQAIVFHGPRVVRLDDVDLKRPGAGMVRVRTALSLVSTGTELIQYTQLFAPQSNWAKTMTYPYRAGYASVGIVEEVGQDVAHLQIGDRVAVRGKHATHHIAGETNCLPIPSELGDEQAVWFALAKIGFAGALAARVELGSRVLVIGAGPIGQMATRWATAAGSSAVVAADPMRARLPLALAGGATGVVGNTITAGTTAILDMFHGRRPEIVIDSSGNASALAEALRIVEDEGRVAVLGTVGSDSSQHLTSDLHWRGITIVGAHEGRTIKDPRWDRDREIYRLFFHLTTSGRFPLEGLITHRFAPKECSDAYALMDNHRGETLGVVFDWSLS